MVEVRNSDGMEPYITKDKSEIREIFHPSNSEIKTMGIAEATVDVGESTKYHYHSVSDEIYYILKGIGILEIEGDVKEVRENDCVFIPVRSRHKIKNVGKVPLKILCISSPPYSDDGTVFV